MMDILAGLCLVLVHTCLNCFCEWGWVDGWPHLFRHFEEPVPGDRVSHLLQETNRDSLGSLRQGSFPLSSPIKPSI